MIALRTPGNACAFATSTMFQSLRRDDRSSDTSYSNGAVEEMAGSNPSDGMIALRTARGVRPEFIGGDGWIGERRAADADFTLLFSSFSRGCVSAGMPQMPCMPALRCSPARRER